MELYELAHQGEAEAQPAIAPRCAGLRLTERLEEVGHECRLDGVAGVA